jgi:hypothetical protein
MKYLALTILFVHFSIWASAQVGIGTSSVEGSAKLQINATDKGFLPPRVALTSTATASNAISSPVAGLLVYNTATAGTTPNNVTPGFYYYDGSKWQRVSNDQPVSTISFDKATPTTLNVAFTPNTPANSAYVYVSSVDNSKWTYNGSTYVKSNQKSVVTGYFTGTYSQAGVRVLSCTMTADPNGDFASNTFTAPRSGLYLVTVNIFLAQKSWSIMEEFNIGLYNVANSESFFLGQYFSPVTASVAAGASSSCVVSLTKDQQVNFRTYNNGSGDYTLYGAKYNQFSITEL